MPDRHFRFLQHGDGLAPLGHAHLSGVDVVSKDMPGHDLGIALGVVPACAGSVEFALAVLEHLLQLRLQDDLFAEGGELEGALGLLSHVQSSMSIA